MALYKPKVVKKNKRTETKYTNKILFNVWLDKDFKKAIVKHVTKLKEAGVKGEDGRGISIGGFMRSAIAAEMKKGA